MGEMGFWIFLVKRQSLVLFFHAFSTLLLFLLPQAVARAEEIIPAKIQSRLAKEFGRLKVHESLPLIDAELFEGLSLGLRYRYGLEPSFNGRYHLRLDRWLVEAKLSPGDWLSQWNERLGLSFTKGSEVAFIRPFKEKGASAIAAPYTPAHIPFTLEKLRSKLQVGDLVVLNTHLTLLLGASQVWGLSPEVSAQVWTHYVVSGAFQIHILKVSPQMARLRFFALKDESIPGGFRLGVSRSWKWVGLEVVDKQLKRLLDATKFVESSMEKGRGKLVLLDYYVRLDRPEVDEAYNKSMNQFFTLKSARLINPFIGQNEKEDLLVADLTALEEMSRLHPEWVSLAFKGTNSTEKRSQDHFKLGVLLASASQGRLYMENFLSLDQSITPTSFKHYLFHWFERSKNWRAFFNFFGSKSWSRAFLLMGATEDKVAQSVENLCFEWELREKKFSTRDGRMVHESLEQVLPLDLARLPQQLLMRHLKESHVNARFFLRLSLSGEALDVLAAQLKGQVLSRWLEHLDQIPKPWTPPLHGVGSEVSPVAGTSLQYYQESLNIAQALEKVLDSSLTPRERSDAFASLRYEDLFIEVGVGFLLSYLPPSLWERLLYIEMSFSSTHPRLPPVQWEWGDGNNREIYHKIRYIYSLLQNDWTYLLQAD